jgi:hypothetical protein
MLIVRATRKLLAHLGPPGLRNSHQCTTQLGEWYATVLPWRPRITLLVNETTLLPVLIPLAPAATWLGRVGGQVAAVLEAHSTPAGFIAEELTHMREYALGPTANRSVVGVMNEFAFLADVHRGNGGVVDLLELAVRLAATPCGPLYRRNISPDRELAAALRTLGAW